MYLLLSVNLILKQAHYGDLDFFTPRVCWSTAASPNANIAGSTLWASRLIHSIQSEGAGFSCALASEPAGIDKDLSRQAWKGTGVCSNSSYGSVFFLLTSIS